MDSHNIQSEKAKAMARYNRLKKISKIWRFLEITIALVLLSLSSTRLPSAAMSAADLAAKSLSLLCNYAYNPLFNFLIFNSIIAVLVLCNRGGAGSGDAGEDGPKMVVFEQSDFELPFPATVTSEEDTAADLKMVVFQKSEAKIDLPAVAPSSEERENECEERESECEAVGAAIEAAERQLRRFERTQSEKLRRDLRRRTRQQLRRLETERAISVIDRVDTLSSEEFQRTIEDFIAKQQRFIAEKKLVGI